MSERVKAKSCTFAELLRDCFANFKDNVFQYRLRIACERASELQSCFLDAGHKGRFYEGVTLLRKKDPKFIAQIYLLSASELLWIRAKQVMCSPGFIDYGCLDLKLTEPNAYLYFCTATVASYKDKRKLERPESEWLRFENTHEAIIDQATWDIVRKVRAGKRRRTSMGDINKYNGLLCCSDCGSKLYFVRGTTIKPENYSFICSRYRKHMGEEQCTPHGIKEVVLDEIILEEIRKATYYARAKTKEFVEFINKKSSSENRRELTVKTNELSKLEKRNTELNALFKRLYEDNVLGKITNEQFRMLSDGYNAEQREIQEQIPKLQAEIEELKAASTNVDKFIDVANKYTDLKELTPEVLRVFIAKVVIYERECKWSKASEQQIDIYFRYIGRLTAEPTKQAV